MCIRDSFGHEHAQQLGHLLARQDQARVAATGVELGQLLACLLYTSDAADERSSVDLGGRRIIKKKMTDENVRSTTDLPAGLHNHKPQHYTTQSNAQRKL